MAVNGERWWGRVPAVATVRQQPMRAPLAWEPICACLCEAVVSGALTEPALEVSRPWIPPLWPAGAAAASCDRS